MRSKSYAFFRAMPYLAKSESEAANRYPVRTPQKKRLHRIEMVLTAVQTTMLTRAKLESLFLK
jgi:hypothetical protein